MPEKARVNALNFHCFPGESAPINVSAFLPVRSGYRLLRTLAVRRDEPGGDAQHKDQVT